MSYLLDSHVLLWSVFDKKKIPAKVQKVLQDPQNVVFVSAVSLWEISLKYRLRKLEFQNFDPLNLPAVCEQMKYELLSLNPEEAASYHLLASDFHKDPFDRMLIRQALQRQIILISGDSMFLRYLSDGLRVLWD